jgi:uncharacterized membrane protein
MVLLPIHIIGGLLGIVSGFVAIFAFKGAKLHRKSGMVFVYSMLVLSITGMVIAIVNGQPFNVVAGLLTAYLVVTGLLTVRRPAVGSFFIGQAQVFPQPLRSSGLLGLPVLLVVVLMVFWVIRVSLTKWRPSFA